MLPATAAALDALRAELILLKPATRDGFEGLVATALAACLGQIVRLAKSGLQFGRDMRTGGTGFTVAAECKRYDSALGLEALAGKATLAARYLADKADLWLVCATSEIGQVAEEEIADLLYQNGLCFVAVDWPDAGFAPLAVLLANAKAVRDVERWFDDHASAVKSIVTGALATIRADPDFAVAEAKLQSQLSVAEAGLATLRDANADWLTARFADPELARATFGQLIGLAPPGLAPLERRALIAELGQKLHAPRTEPAVVVITGEEGLGKTWLVPRWWDGESEAPILLLVAGRRTAMLDPAQARRSLARLLADEAGRDSERDIGFWLRRLDRWRTEPAMNLRFVLMIDGINEHQGEPWSDIIRTFARELDALGGIVCVTARPHYWEREVEPRLRNGIERRRISVPRLSEAEVDTLLGSATIDADALSPTVRDFLRTPRVAIVAIRLIAARALAPENLTVDRLLLEYWRHRLDERGDLVHHNLVDFDRLLRSHARDWLDAPRAGFERVAWTRHSSLSELGRRDAHDDLTEIEEGRFLTINPDDPDRYGFTAEGLPFALALLLNAELKRRLRDGDAAHQIIDQIIDPIRGFEELSAIVASAIAIGLSEAAFPDEALASLINQFSGLQNKTEEAVEVILAHLRERPGPFLDLLERPARALSGATNLRFLEELLLGARDAPKVLPAIHGHLPRWLGHWTSEARRWGETPERRQIDHDAAIAAAFAAMNVSERALFDRLSWRTEQRPAGRLVALAGLMLAARPIAPVADGIVGFGLTAFAADWLRSGDDLGWAVRLNPLDHDAVRRSVDAALAAIDAHSSEAMRQGASIAYRMVGDRAGAERAELLWPLMEGVMRRRAERYCETNPLDPRAKAGDNLSEAAATAAAIDVDAIWSSFAVGGEDHRLEGIGPALARFDVAPLQRLVNAIVMTGPARRDMPLRQMGWQSLGVAALLEAPARAALVATLDRLRADPTLLDVDDRQWIFAWMSRAVTAHEPAEQQLDRLIALPAGTPLYLNMRWEFRPLPEGQVGGRLDAAVATGGETLLRTIFFLGAHAHRFEPSGATHLIDAFLGSEPLVSSCAADAIVAADDPAMFDQLLDRLSAGPARLAGDDPGHARAYAVARAVIARGRADLIDLVSPQFLGAAAAALDGEALVRFADQAELMMARIAGSAPVEKPADIDLFLGVDTGGRPLTRWAEEAAPPAADTEGEAGLERFFQRFNESMSEDSSRLKGVNAAADRYAEELAAQGLDDIGRDPPRDGLAALAAAEPDRVRRWLSAILATTDRGALMRQRNMGVALAGAIAPVDPALAAAALARLRAVGAPVTIVYGEHHVPLYEHVVYGAPRDSALDRLRADLVDSARDDLALGTQARLADAAGASDWLDTHIAALAASAVPGKAARGLTLAGMRIRTERSAALLAGDHGPGFAGWVADSARRPARHFDWAKHWLGELAAARDPVDAWRCATLAAKVVDLRFIAVWPVADPSWAPFAGVIFEMLHKAAEKRENNRKSALFGQKAPSGTFWSLFEIQVPALPV